MPLAQATEDQKEKIWELGLEREAKRTYLQNKEAFREVNKRHTCLPYTTFGRGRYR
jgi:hypothetical protein